MNLNLDTIKSITTGAVRVEENENGISFFRFTKAQEELYRERNTDFYLKSFASSGVRLSFSTGSLRLGLKFDVDIFSSRKYYSLVLFVNGEKTAVIGNFKKEELPLNYTVTELEKGCTEAEFDLGAGEKHIEIFLPWSTRSTLKELSLDDDSFVVPVIPSKKLLCFGDSITQGYDALEPNNRYAARLADFLGAAEYNKAIGGEVFFPELAASKEDFIPDYISVAYGTNDWAKCEREVFIKNCREFFANLYKNYSDVTTFVLTPIWRHDYDTEKAFGDFFDVEKIIKETVSEYENMSVIRGFDFVPHEKGYYADLFLHPRDEGFDCYAENLCAAVKEALEEKGL